MLQQQHSCKGVAALVNHHLQEEALPSGRLNLTAPPLFDQLMELSPAQLSLFERINAALFEDYRLRRRMLLKRLDVTLESFMWGAETLGNEGEIVAAIHAQRQHLTEMPSKYTVCACNSCNVLRAHDHDDDDYYYAVERRSVSADDSGAVVSAADEQQLRKDVEEQCGQVDHHWTGA